MGRACGAGGRLGLCKVLKDHAEAIEFDLLGIGFDLQRDLGGRLTWRRLRVILTYLPPSSAFKREANPDAVWEATPQLLATLIDNVAVSNYYLARVTGAKPAKPTQIPRPGVGGDSKTSGGSGVPLEAMDQLLGWSN